ncbi:NAD-dependent epimerase/dehydratase family protein [Pseudomonas sp. D2-30]|uniref:NAD-dependent epimerase/dehydratase family protein n=1 Tax=unclassified Pseudomonas TaxID=196821 RepID=UPI003DA9261C
MSVKDKLVITGSTGFVGRALVERLYASCKYDLTLLVRRHTASSSGITQIVVPEYGAFAHPLPLEGTKVAIHLAGRAHVLNDASLEPLLEFRKVNVGATVNFAEQCILAGVKRFIFVSSIGVNGAITGSEPFNELSPPRPAADYAISKMEAEQALRDLVAGTEMELVIIRPPLVYAGHAPGNFRKLLKLVSSRLPLPFAASKNCRTMISLENLVDFIFLCLEHPLAANELFLVADTHSLSTKEIINSIAEGMGRRTYLYPVPDIVLSTLASLFGRRAVYYQLCGSLVIDSRKAQNLLGWIPPVSTIEALRQAGSSYIAGKRH